MSNLFWGMQFAPFSHKTALNRRSSLISLVLRKNGAKPHRHYFDCRFVQSTNLMTKFNKKSLLKFLLLLAFAKSRVSLLSRHCEANRRFAEAIQKIAQPNLARFVVQKIGIKDAVVPSADFLLEKELRGTPPKSEKRQLLARRGSGVGGAALLRKEKGDKELVDSKADLSAESCKEMDSRFALDSLDLDCFGQSPRNDESTHDLLLPNLTMTFPRKSPTNPPHLRRI